jgi:glutaconyl-CoA/methylmalonyl-CoA decarboxylase subunit gamma
MKVTVKIDEQVFEVEIEDLETRPIRATLDGQTFEVWTDDKTPIVTTQLPVTPVVPRAAQPVQVSRSNGANSGKAIAAPIPGVIIAVAIQPNTTVAAGQEVCTLEAMKMNNVIRAPRDGRISAVLVKVGEQVRQKQALMEYAD